jgi:hypothetical protein
MRLARPLLALLTVVLATASCGRDLTSNDRQPQLWMSVNRSGTGADVVEVLDNLLFWDDGRFEWTQTVNGDGAGHPYVFHSGNARAGKYRMENGILDLRTETITVFTGLDGTRQRTTRVPDPHWTGLLYRYAIDGPMLTLRSTTGPADAPVETVQVFGAGVIN